MGKLEDTYAVALLQYATERERLQETYRQASMLLGKPLTPLTEAFDDSYVTGELVSFLAYLKTRGREKDTEAILERFLEMARSQLGIVDVEVITAIPLTDKQLENLQRKLIQRARKMVYLYPKVDPAIIAGVRLVAKDFVLDTSVRTRLLEMKEEIYKGVYFSK